VTRLTTYAQQRAKERLRIKSSSIFGNASKKEVQKRLAIDKCLKNGVDLKLFLKKTSSTGATLTNPARVDFKHSKQKFVREERRSSI